MKLPIFGFPPALTSWAASFLSKRTICIPVDGVSSQPFLVNTGVLQKIPTWNHSLFIWGFTIQCIQSSSLFDARFLAALCAMQTPTSIATVRSSVYHRILNTLEHIYSWGPRNQTDFKASETYPSFLRKSFFHSLRLFSLNWTTLTDSISLLSLPTTSLRWSPLTSLPSSRGASNVDLPIRARFFTLAHLLPCTWILLSHVGCGFA